MKRLAVILSALLVMIGCNQGEELLPNPFFEQWTTPYGVPPFESIKNYHYQPAFERAMSLHLEEIEAIVAQDDEPTFENTVAAMDRSGRMLSDVSNVFGMMMPVSPVRFLILSAMVRNLPCWVSMCSKLIHQPPNCQRLRIESLYRCPVYLQGSNSQLLVWECIRPCLQQEFRYQHNPSPLNPKYAMYRL